MYEMIKSIIISGDFKVTDITNKIDVLWVNGDFTVLLDEIDVIQKTIQENNKLFKRLMWSYEHIRELGE